MKRDIDEICNELRTVLNYQYAKGVRDAIQLLNEKYLIKVWDKKDSDKLFDDLMETLRDLNIKFSEVVQFYNKTNEQENVEHTRFLITDKNDTTTRNNHRLIDPHQRR